MRKLLANPHTWLLIAIVLVGAALRLYQYPQLEFSHDEFSALHRTGYESFEALIKNGVATDAHPAFAQVLMHYTIQYFGAHPAVVKLPFVLMGIACIPLIFWLVKMWGSTTSGLLAAATVATLQYPIIYSTLARPYGSGLFFSILMLIFWSYLIKKPQIKFDLTAFGFVLFAALSTQNHHFGLLFVGLVGIAGLFLVQAHNRWRYVFLGLMVGALYLPYLPIFWVQLQKGGVEGWLAKPSNDFLWQYIRYIWHFSAAPLLLAGFFFVMGLVSNGHHKTKRQRHLLWWALFLMPFVIGFLYSKYISAVLQYSVLLFSFPSLMVLVFGGLKDWGIKKNIGAVLAVMALNIFTLIANRQHYKVFTKSFYAEAFVAAHQISDAASTGFLMEMPTKIAAHYHKKWALTIDTIPKETSAFLTWLHHNHTTKKQLLLALDANTDPRKLAWASAFFPEVDTHHTYFGGDVYLLKKGSSPKPLIEKQLISSNNAEFLPGVTWAFSEKTLHRNDFLDVWLTCADCTTAGTGTLVVEILLEKDVIFWQGYPLDAQVLRVPQNAWVNTIKLADLPNIPEGALLRAYLWNPQKLAVPAHHLHVVHRPGNPILYGWYNPVASW